MLAVRDEVPVPEPIAGKLRWLWWDTTLFENRGVRVDITYRSLHQQIAGESETTRW